MMTRQKTIAFSFWQALQSASPVITAECPAGLGETFKSLRQSGRIHSFIVPELNIWESLLNVHLILKDYRLTRSQKLERIRKLLRKRWHYNAIQSMTGIPGPILTVAANIKTRRSFLIHLEKSLQAGARGWLMVSGGGLPWRSPVLKPFQPLNSIRMLKLGREFIRAHGLREYPLLAAANPYRENFSRLGQKIAAGADALITQPAVLPDTFTRWWNQLQQTSMAEESRWIIGIPYAPTAEWYKLWNVMVRANSATGYMINRLSLAREGRFHYNRFVAGQTNNKPTEFAVEWTRERIVAAMSLGGVGGLHFYHTPFRALTRYLPVSSE